MEENIKETCLEFFRRLFQSKSIRECEGILAEFPFSDHQVHSLYNFIHKIERDEYKSIAEVYNDFTEECRVIIACTESSSPLSYFIKEVLYNITKSIEKNLLLLEKDFGDISFGDKLDNINNKIMLPNNRESMAEMLVAIENDSVPVFLQAQPIYDNDTISYDDVCQLKERLDEMPSDKNRVDIAEMIQRNYKTEPGDKKAFSEVDGEFNVDLTQLPPHIINKVRKYLDETVSRRSRTRTDVSFLPPSKQKQSLF